MDDIPRYRVLQDSFFEPNPVLRGSIIATTTSPGPHLQPLNPAAVARMEEWYSQEFDELDPKTRRPTGQKIRPHEIHRIGPSVAGERHDAVVLSAPPKDTPGSLSLPESFSNQRVSTDQRPPGDGSGHLAPAPTPPPVPSPAPAPTEPTLGDALGGRAVAEAPVPLPEAHTPLPSTPSDGSASPPEPEPVAVEFSAPPPSAKKIS